MNWPQSQNKECSNAELRNSDASDHSSLTEEIFASTLNVSRQDTEEQQPESPKG